MRQPPPIAALPRYPITGGTALLAIGATIAFLKNPQMMEPLMEDAHLYYGEYWRLLTSIFIHINVLHLFFNLTWLWSFGTIIEEDFGHFPALGVYILLAAGSGAAEYALMDGGVGLSGVGYGLFGLLWVLSKTHRNYRDAVDKQTAFLFVGWGIFCFITTQLGIMRVGNLAHGIGAVLGGLLGLTMVGSRFRRINAGVALVVLVIASIAGAVRYRPWVNLSENRGDSEDRLGYACLTENNYVRAEELYRRATLMNDENNRFWQNYGCALNGLERYDEAKTAFAKAEHFKLKEKEQSKPAPKGSIPGFGDREH